MSEVREQLLETIKLMVDEPEQVELDEIDDGDVVTFRLRVAESDLGKVIGRQGRTARAIRTLLGAREAVSDQPYEFEILD